MQVTTYILDSVKEQQRVIALENCFQTWDGNVDIDVILQGLHDRFAAINKPLSGICIERSGLNNISIFTEEMTLCEIVQLPVSQCFDTYWRVESPLHEHEELEMAKWLFKNFHH